MAFDADSFWQEIQRSPVREEELSDSEGSELATILANPLFRHVLCVAYQEVHGCGSTILALDLSDQKMLHRAMDLQGRARGVVRFIEALVEQIPAKKEEADGQEE